MNIPSNLTDEDFINLVVPESHYNNTNELLGKYTTLTNELHTALYLGRNQVTSEVLGVLAEIHAMTITASRGYIHK